MEDENGELLETAEFIELRAAGGPFIPRSEQTADWAAVEILGQAHMRIPKSITLEDVADGVSVNGLPVLEMTSEGIALVMVGSNINWPAKQNQMAHSATVIGGGALASIFLLGLVAARRRAA